MATAIVLDKSQVKKLQEDNEVAYRDIWNLLQRGKEYETGVDEIILRIADNIKSIMLSAGQTESVNQICSLIQRSLALKSMGHLSSRVYRLLPDDMKQKAYDHSTSKTLATDSDKYPQQFENYEREWIEKMKSFRNVDWSHMRRHAIQELQAEGGEIDIFFRNYCTNTGITLVETNHDPLNRSTKKTIQHLRYLPRTATKLHEVYRNQLRRWADKINKLAEMDEKFPMDDDKLPEMIKSIRVWNELFDPWLDAKHHLDWLGWFKVWKLLKDYNINKVADLTKITDDNDLPRGMTREAIQNWLQKKGQDFFVEFIKHCPGIFDLCLWYKTTLPAKYGLTNRMWGKAPPKDKAWTGLGPKQKS